MANPFLMGDLEAEPPAAGINPFLSGGDFGGISDDPTAVPDNPFVSALSNGYRPSGNTNPFAFGASDPTDGFFAPGGTSAEPTAAIDFSNIFATPAVVQQPPETEIFSPRQPPPPKPAPPKPVPPAHIIAQLPPQPQQPVSVPDLFDAFSDPTPPASEQQLLPERPPIPPATRPSGLEDLFDTGTGVQNVPTSVNLLDDILVDESVPSVVPCGQGLAGGIVPPPMRPPPPRPAVPPSKETKELILSVTGAMEATSSDLLDRLQANRTPSPTPIRELHSPSPTPDMMQVTDLLGVDIEPEMLGSEDVPAEPISVPIDECFVQTDATESMLEMTPSPEPVIAAVPPVGVRPPGPPPRPVPPAVPDRPRAPPAKPPLPQSFVTAPEVPQGGTSPFDVPPPDPPQMASPFASDTVPQSSTVTSDMFDLSATEETVQANDSGFFGAEHPVAESAPAFQESMFFDTTITDTTAGDMYSAQNGLDLFGTAVEQEQTQPAAAPIASTDFFSTTIQPDPYGFGVDPKHGAAYQSNAGDAFDIDTTLVTPETRQETVVQPPGNDDAFDAFAAKFESAGNLQQSAHPFDPFSGSSAFGDATQQGGGDVGFGADDSFDAFLALREEGPPPVPQSTPARISRGDSRDSDEGNDFNIFIKPKAANADATAGAVTPILAPPPKSPVQDLSPRFNPFDKSQDISGAAPDNFFASADAPPGVLPVTHDDVQATRPMERTESQETPPTPLFDEDVSQPLEDFPRIHFADPGWEMQLRQPNKKKITGQRFWKKVFIRLVMQGENPVLQLFNNKDDKDPFQELPLQPCYSVSEIGAQQYDQFGKIFTVKLQFIFYKERPGVRPGQVTKAERLTNKLSQFAAYAIQGDYQGVKEFGSDLKKLGLPVEHAPQISQLFKIGSHSYEDMKQFSVTIEEALFRLSAHRDRALNYKMEEVQITAVDELYVEQNRNGGITRQIARVRLFFLGFLSGMPDIELGVNDMVRQGKEVVGRHDIIPVVTEEWIRLENVEFHSCVQQDEYERTRTIKFKPPDSCYLELMRFRVRPPKNRELPLQVKTTMCINGNKVELKSDVLVPGFSSRKLGQIPCEDVMIRFPIPECWIYLFRVEKHFRYGSVKSAHRRSGKIKGIERFLGAVDNLEPSLMEVTSGQAKYEHQHRAIVWRMPRLPKEGQGAYTTHNLVCKMALTSYDQIPDQLAQHCFVEFTMPVTQVSHTTVRSVSISNSDSDTPPEKYVRQLARHEYIVEIEHTTAEGPGDYIAATSVSKPIAEEPTPPPPAAPATTGAESDSDSSS